MPTKYNSHGIERVLYFLVIEVISASNSFFSFLSIHSLTHSSQFEFMGRKHFQMKIEPFIFQQVVCSKLRVCKEIGIVISQRAQRVNFQSSHRGEFVENLAIWKKKSPNFVCMISKKKLLEFSVGLENPKIQICRQPKVHMNSEENQMFDGLTIDIKPIKAQQLRAFYAHIEENQREAHALRDYIVQRGQISCFVCRRLCEYKGWLRPNKMHIALSFNSLLQHSISLYD